MFETLTKGFRAAKNRLQGNVELTEENIDQALRDVRMSLLEADVELGVTKNFLAKVAVEQAVADVIGCNGYVCAAIPKIGVRILTTAGQIVADVQFPVESLDVRRLAITDDGQHILGATNWSGDLVVADFVTRVSSLIQVGARAADVAVAGDVVAVAAGEDGLVLYDGSELPALHFVEDHPASAGDASSVALDDRWAFGCSDEEGTNVLDAFDLRDGERSDPAYTVELPDECIDLQATPSHLYVADDGVFLVIDRGCTRWRGSFPAPLATSDPIGLAA
jgi:hypothetical protein